MFKNLFKRKSEALRQHEAVVARGERILAAARKADPEGKNDMCDCGCLGITSPYVACKWH